MAQVLRTLPTFSDPNLLVGIEHFDDAAVYRLDATTAVVATLDFFPPLVDDPYTFGQIAAANSLSDIYAMGARPLMALNIVGFPDKELPAEVLGEILRGGAERVAASGAVLAGGHSVRDAEIKYGLAVTGLVHPERILTNGRARIGDSLVLSKPIGSGVLTSAAKADKVTEADLAEAIDTMIDLNAGACQAMLENDVHSVTDITGFGLLGHALEMAEASDVTIVLDARNVPLLHGTIHWAAEGFLTRAGKASLEHLGARLQVGQGVDETLVKVLADAQTSGGLLGAMPADRVDDVLAAMRRLGTKAAVCVGRVDPPSAHRVVLE